MLEIVCMLEFVAKFNNLLFCNLYGLCKVVRFVIGVLDAFRFSIRLFKMRFLEFGF